MKVKKATIKNRRIEFEAPDELPDGTEVLVEVSPFICEKIGIEESEWRDDPEALADWEAWIKTIEAIDLTTEEQENINQFNQKFHQFNIEAVRKQMEEGIHS